MKSTAHEVELRVTVILELMARRLTRSQILQYVEDNHDDWGIKPSMIDKYIAKARKVMIIRANKHRDHVLAETLNDLNTLYSMAVDQKDIRSALAVTQERSKLLSAYEIDDTRRKLKDVTDSGGTSDLPIEIEEMIQVVEADKDSHLPLITFEAKTELHKKTQKAKYAMTQANSKEEEQIPKDDDVDNLFINPFEREQGIKTETVSDSNDLS